MNSVRLRKRVYLPKRTYYCFFESQLEGFDLKQVQIELEGVIFALSSLPVLSIRLAGLSQRLTFSLLAGSPMKKMVGAVGFEPTTSWSRTKRATKLRYAPTQPIIKHLEMFREKSVTDL
jgi:hypothetical protein